MSNFQVIMVDIEVEARRARPNTTVILRDHERFGRLFLLGGAVRVPIGSTDNAPHRRALWHSEEDQWPA